MKYQFVLETGNWKPWFLDAEQKGNKLLRQIKVQNLGLGLTAESCRKSKTNNQQLLRDKLKLELKYEVNIRFETQIWKSGPNL